MAKPPASRCGGGDSPRGPGLRRQPNPADGRSTIVALTPAGRRAFRSAAPVYLRRIARHFTDLLTTDELACIRTALDKVVTHHAGSARGGYVART